MTTSNGHHPITFSPDQVIALPAEAWYLVDNNLNKAEMRVTLCILFNAFQVGVEAQPLSFAEIVKQTGMSKSSVSEGLDAAIARGSVFRKNSCNQPRYEPRFGKTELMTCINTCNDSLTETLHTTVEEHDMGSEKPNRTKVLEVLVRFGLAYHVAHNIAMSNRYELQRLETQLLYIFDEIRKGSAPTGRAFYGYVVNRIKFDKFPPKDFDPTLATIQKIMSQTGKTRNEVFMSFACDEISEEIPGLEYHPDYQQWFNSAIQNGEIQYDEQ